ncbi:RNA polymerase sigma factor [Albibacterium profundi]|uniref:Sigma-70 family RNA polymerase sigma factor n=1 Tax=Albibacterium profundi TaxID=3134906 RepID=A0ABV5CCV6_9SPHI
MNDLQLLALVRKDNGLAFQEIYNRYWRVLYNSAYQKLQSAPLAEEMVQETFLNLYVKRDTVQVSDSLSPYLHSVLKNKVIDEIRKQISSKKYQDTLSVQPPVTAISSHDLLEEKEVKEKIIEFSETLPKRCREVFLMKQQDLSNKMIAEMLQISEKTVEGHISYARKLLRSYMTELYLYSLIFLISYIPY